MRILSPVPETDAPENLGGVLITFAIPSRGPHPSVFRRNVRIAVRNGIASAAMRGDLDFALADEAFRALPVEEQRR